MTSTSHPPRPANVDRRRRAVRRRWVATYWATTMVSALFLVMAVSAPDIPAGSYAALGFGCLAGVCGSLMAARLHRAGVDVPDFHEATAAVRTLAVAWLVLIAALVVATVVGTGLGERPTAGPGAIEAVLAVADGVAAQVFGAAAFFVVVGDGYTKYARLLDRRSPPPSSDAAPGG